MSLPNLVNTQIQIFKPTILCMAEFREWHICGTVWVCICFSQVGNWNLNQSTWTLIKRTQIHLANWHCCTAQMDYIKERGKWSFKLGHVITHIKCHLHHLLIVISVELVLRWRKVYVLLCIWKCWSLLSLWYITKLTPSIGTSCF